MRLVVTSWSYCFYRYLHIFKLYFYSCKMYFFFHWKMTCLCRRGSSWGFRARREDRRQSDGVLRVEGRRGAPPVGLGFATHIITSVGSKRGERLRRRRTRSTRAAVATAKDELCVCMWRWCNNKDNSTEVFRSSNSVDGSRPPLGEATFVCILYS